MVLRDIKVDHLGNHHHIDKLLVIDAVVTAKSLIEAAVSCISLRLNILGRVPLVEAQSRRQLRAVGRSLKKFQGVSGIGNWNFPSDGEKIIVDGCPTQWLKVEMRMR